MGDLDEAFRKTNLLRAWNWLKSNPNATYKSYCAGAYSRYAVADSDLLKDLRDRLKRGIYDPTHSCKLLFPKKSGILRPYSVLTVEDQIVYQAMVNVIAERFAPRVRGRYLRSTFGHMYAGTSSKWFYKRWQAGYSAFNRVSKRSFARGLVYTATFDLTACYDSVDHGVLEHFLRRLKCDQEFCSKLKQCLAHWTATGTLIYHNHGIPQGPLGSGLLAEVVLSHFDTNFGQSSNVQYLRYVDDIRLFATREEHLRRLLVRLDTLSKDIGLFPQSNKINIHRVSDIDSELKSVSSAYDTDEDDLSGAVSQSRAQKGLVNASGRGRVIDETRFKFFLGQATPHSQTNSRLLRISQSRPDLVSAVMRHFRKYDWLPVSVVLALIARLRDKPLYEHTIAEIVATLDGRTRAPYTSRVKRILRRRWRPGSMAPDHCVAVGGFLINQMALSADSVRHALTKAPDWWVRSQLFGVIQASSGGPHFLQNTLNEGISDSCEEVAIAAAHKLGLLSLKVIRPLKTVNRAAAVTLRQLGVVSRLPRGVDGVERSFVRLLGRSTRVDWRKVFGGQYKQAEKQSVFCRACAETDATAFVNALDVFNDLLLSRIYRHEPALGTYALGSIGGVLTSTRLRARYPAVFDLVNKVHEKRYLSSLSHAVARRTGKPTVRIKFKYIREAGVLIRRACSEIVAKW